MVEAAACDGARRQTAMGRARCVSKLWWRASDAARERERETWRRNSNGAATVAARDEKGTRGERWTARQLLR